MQSEQQTCKGTRKDGKPCTSTILGANGRCYVHGTPPDVLVEEQRQAGLASGAARRELGKSVRERLREKVEEHTEEIWDTYHEGLSATDGDGKPDHRARVQAATALLAEAYGKPIQPTREEGPPKLIVVRPARATEDETPKPLAPVRELPKPG